MGLLGGGGKHPPQDMPAHTPGIKQGNSTGNYDKQAGHHPDGTSDAERSTGVNAGGREPTEPSLPDPAAARDGASDAERSTGVNAGAREPIDPSMPNLSPA